MKRKTFRRIFIKRLVLWLSGAIALLVVVTGVLNLYTFSVGEMAYYNYKDSVVNKLYAEYSTLSQTCTKKEDIIKQLENRISLILGGSSVLYNAASIYDSDTEELLMDSSEKCIAVIIDEKNEKVDYYSCDVEYMGDYEAYLRREKENSENIYYYAEEEFATEVRDIYISDYKFLPGELDIVFARGEKCGKVYMSYDLTPEDTSGYERIVIGEDTGYKISCFVLTGNGEDSHVAKILDDYIKQTDTFSSEEELYVDTTMLKYGFYEVTTCGMVNVVLGGDMKLRVYMCVNFNVSGTWGGLIVFVYALVLTVAVAFAILNSGIKYTKLKSQYDMEDYRRTMTNAMAHDLKSPLMIISGYAENLKGNPNMDKREHYATSILDTVDYMNSIISNILELSRLETGRIILKKEELDIKHMLEKILAEYENLIAEKELTAGVEGELSVSGDRQLLTQAFDNLISNACKYTKEGGNISVTLERKKITITNPGIEDVGDKISELWKPFVKGDNSRNSKKGSGIGLTISKNIFEQHGYRMTLSVEDGLFTVYIEI